MQDIDPVTTLYSRLIQPGAGDPDIEQKAAAIASYGKQLGLITEVLLEVVKQSKSLPESHASLTELKRIQSAIEDLKTKEYTLRADELLAQVERFKERGGDEYEALARKLRGSLGDERGGEG